MPMQTGYVAPDWKMHDRPQRALAAVLAVLICLGLLQQLNLQSGGKWKRLAIDDPASVMRLQLIPVRPLTAIPPERVQSKSFTSTKSWIQARPPKRANAQPVSSEVNATREPSTPTQPTASIETAEPLSSLRFDREAIARAYKESKSEIQKMAEASGKDRIMEIGPPSKSERYQASIARGFKPDCVGKDTAGAGLLAIPLIGYLIATDKCNFRK